MLDSLPWGVGRSWLGSWLMDWAIMVLSEDIVSCFVKVSIFRCHVINIIQPHQIRDWWSVLLSFYYKWWRASFILISWCIYCACEIMSWHHEVRIVIHSFYWRKPTNWPFKRSLWLMMVIKGVWGDWLLESCTLSRADQTRAWYVQNRWCISSILLLLIISIDPRW